MNPNPIPTQIYTIPTPNPIPLHMIPNPESNPDSDSDSSFDSDSGFAPGLAWLEMDVVARTVRLSLSLRCTESEKPGEQSQSGRCHSNSHSPDFINVHPPPPHSIGFHLMSQMTVYSPIRQIIISIILVFSFIFQFLLAYPTWYWFSDK